MSPNLKTEKSPGTLKLGPKEHTKSPDSGHTKDICLGSKIRVKKIKRTRKKALWLQKQNYFCP